MMEVRTTICEQEGETVSESTTIGLDLAKHTFHVVGCDRHGKVLKRKVLRRRQVRTYFCERAGVCGGDGGVCECALLGA